MKELLDSAFERFTERTAIVSGGASWTYGDLDRETRAIAAYVDARIQDGDRVVLRGEHTVGALIWAIGCLRSRGVYTPLSTGIPPERASHFLDVARPGLVLTFDVGDRNELAARSPHNVESIEDIQRPDLGTRRDNWAARSVEYSIFTSGTSGVPKLVDIGPGGIQNLAATAEEVFGIRPNDTVLHFAALSFDASVSEILLAFRVGARLAVPRPSSASWLADVAHHLETEDADVLIVPPSVYSRLPTRGIEKLRVVIFAGEPLGESEFDRAAAHSHVFNAYGPTETTVCFSATPVTEYSRSVGNPITGFEARVRDPDTGMYSTYGEGELVAVGEGVALRYAGHDDDEPFGYVDGKRAYHTGDQVRLNDGEIFFVGRVDDQIKRMGHRLNLADLELVLASRLDRSCALVARDGEVLLVIELGGDDVETARRTARGVVERTLAPWETPDRTVVLDELPLTAHGKIDKAMLRNPAARTGESDESSTEDGDGRASDVDANPLTQVVSVTEDVLGRLVDPNTSVFAAGANSLDLMKIQVRLSEIFDEAAVEDAFTAMSFDFTPADFAALIAGTNADAVEGDTGARPTGPVPEAVQAAERLQGRITVAANRQREPHGPGALLITGVNGFVGGRVLARALSGPTAIDGPILVVATNPDRLRERHAERFGRELSDYDRVSVGTYEEFAADPTLGTTTGPPAAVVHCGFHVNHRLPLEQQMLTSVENTAIIAEGAVDSRSVVLLSAASVGTEFVDLDEQTLSAIGDPYSQSKLVAESCLTTLGEHGPAVSIFRAGLVYGHRQGEQSFLRDDRVAELLRACLAIGSVPAFPGLLPLCDGDDVADTLLTAATSARSARETTVTATVEASDVATSLGLDLEAPDDWLRAAKGNTIVDQRHLPGFAALTANPGWKVPASSSGDRLLSELVDAVMADSRAA